MAEGIDPNMVTGTVHLSDGEKVTITAESLFDYLNARGERVEDVIRYNVTPLGGGLAQLTFTIWDDTSLEYTDKNIPIPFSGNDAIRADVPYFALFDGESNPSTTRLWACTEDALVTSSDTWMIEKISLTIAADDGTEASADDLIIEERTEDGGTIGHSLADFGLDPNNLFAFYKSDEDRYITLNDALAGLLIVRASLGIAAQALASKRESAESGRYIRTKDVPIIIDISPASNAVFNPANPHYLQPQDYFSGNSKTVPVGDAGSLEVALKASADVDMGADPITYMLKLPERYWLDFVSTMAKEGHSTIRGSDLLKLAGYTNPYQRSAADTMGEAARAAFKMLHTGLFIDTTGEKIRKSAGGRRLVSSRTFRPIIDGEFSLDEYEDGNGTVRDFEIRLRDKDDPIRSLPFLGYSLMTGRYLEAKGTPECFSGLRLNTDHRLMWWYIDRQLRSKGLRDTILFETMFKALDIGQDGSRAAQQKRKRMIDMLEKMLRRAAGGHKTDGRLEYEPIIKAWSYKTRAGRRIGVDIVPLDK